MKKHTSLSVSRLILSLSAVFAAGQAFAGEITVSAAASLTDAFKEIGAAYQKQHPNSKVQFNFGSSGALLQQIDKGAPVDVFASADQATMDLAQQKKLVKAAQRSNFVGNSLVLVTPVNGTLAIKSMSDLRQGGVKHIALGNPATTPAGRYAKAAMEQAKLWQTLEPKIVNTQNVRQALDYVARHETEAGFVFGTDAAIMKNKVKVAAVIPTQKAITYPIAQIASSRNAAEAQQFIRFVRSQQGQSILHRYGFRSIK